MTQAADRRQLDASSTPPSHPASGWRRDHPETGPGNGITQAPSGAFSIPPAEIGLRPPDRPALVMVLAPVIGLAIWVGAFVAIFWPV